MSQGHTYETIVVSAIHEAMVGLVRDYRENGITAVDLSKDGGILKTNGRWTLSVKVEKLEPVRGEATEGVRSGGDPE
jgi:hypothetical protein